MIFGLESSNFSNSVFNCLNIKILKFCWSRLIATNDSFHEQSIDVKAKTWHCHILPYLILLVLIKLSVHLNCSFLKQS